MDKLKAFIKGKKVDKHFKQSGKGVRLSEASSSNAPSIVSGSAQGSSIDRVAASDVAAQAAMKRLYKEEPKVPPGKKKIQMMARRELEEEERRRQDPAYAMEQLSIQPRKETEVREFEHSGAISGVFYTCEMLGEDCMLTKPDLMKTLEDFLIDQLVENDEAVTPAVLLLYSLNTTSARSTAVETIGKYLQNIVENPEDPKYRKIRIANKAIQERVFSCKGGREFLAAVGFSQQMLSPKEGDPAEPFLVMPGEIAENSGALISALEALREGHSIPIKVARNASIFVLGDNERVTVPKVSADFFDVTAEEVKKEQQAKTDEVNRMLSLRTKEMRERDEKLRQFKYKYTLIRIRLPDRFVIEGTFGCYEPVSTVREFIAAYLSDASAGVPWTLKDPMNGRNIGDMGSLGELGLAPAAVLHLDFDEPFEGCVLGDDHREKAVPFEA